MILGILQARVSSTRLPGKVLLPLMGAPMLARQIERLRRSAMIDQLSLATSTEVSDDPLEELAEQIGLPVFHGALDDVLDRFYQAALPYNPDHVVRLTGDCPLGDPRRPVDSALIPPVVKHWGLNIFYPVFENPDALPVESRIGSGGIVPLEAPGTINFDPQAGTRCTIMRSNAIATCQVGTGRVTLIADAALFEHSELAGEDGATLRAVLAASLR